MLLHNAYADNNEDIAEPVQDVTRMSKLLEKTDISRRFHEIP